MRHFHIRALIALAFFASAAFAQTRASRLEGTVQDQSGAVVPGAKVTAINAKTQSRGDATTGPQGEFTIPTLQPGTYTISVEASGFRKTVINDLELNVGETQSQIVKMEVGQTSESVMVEANAASVQTTDSDISNAITMRNIDTLPQLNRSPITLAIFQAGVQIDVRAGQDASFSHVNGLRQGSNNSTLDGIDVNDSLVPRLGLSLTSNNSDSVEEFRVVTEGGKAEFGRSAGAQVQLITRSGTNEYHWSAYDYLRNTALNANDFFNNQSGSAVPKLIRNIYGASFGGPIIHNKTFIFGNFQGTRTKQETVRNRTIPTALARAGIFQYKDAGGAVRQYDFGKADPRGIGPDPGVAKILAQYPLPNNNDLGDGLNTAGYRFNNPTPSLEDQFTIKGDHHLTNNHVLFLRWSWQRNSSTDGLNNADATFPGQIQGTQGGKRWGFSTGSDWTLSPTLVNEFRIGHQSATVDFLRPNRPAGTAFINSSGWTDLQYSAFTQGRNSPVNDMTENLTKVWGKHTLKGGLNLRFTKQYGYNFAGIYPNVTTTTGNGNSVPLTIGPSGLSSTDRTKFENLYNDVLGRVDQVVQTFYSDLQTFQPAGSPRIRNFNLFETGAFFQDDFRVSRRLTLNLGVRLDYYGLPTEENNLQGLVDKRAQINGVNQLTDISISKGNKWFSPSKKNFAPRFGFAYDVFGDGKMAIRGNYGIFYDRSVGALVNTVDGNTPGFSQSVPVYPNLNGTDVRFSDKYAGPAAPPAPVLQLPLTRSTSLVLVDPNLKSGYVQSYSLNVQRQLDSKSVLQVGYVGNRGEKLFMDVDVNQPRINGDFLNAFKELQAFVIGGAAPSAGNTLVKIFGTPAAAVSALNSTNLRNGNVGAVANTLDRNQYTKYAAAGVSQTYLRNFPQFNQVVLGTNNGRSYFDSLQVTLRRTAGALQLQANYTWSKSMDNISTEGNGFNTPIDSYNLGLNRARADFDRPHSFNLTSIYTLPIGRGKMLGGQMPVIFDKLLGGWSLGNLMILQNGQPFSVSSQRSTVAISGVGNSYAQYSGTDRTIGGVTRQGNGVYFFSPSEVALFGFPSAGEYGNSGRNVFRNPNFFEIDSSLVKKFVITERHTVSFRAEAYNLTNHPNFGLAAANLNINTPATFGKFSSTLGTQVGGSSARTLQMVLRYDF